MIVERRPFSINAIEIDGTLRCRLKLIRARRASLEGVRWIRSAKIR